MRSSVALLAVAVNAVSAAVANYTSSLNMTITASSVEAQTRATWCQAQTNTCTTLCGSTDSNSCTQTTLAYDCTCASNSSAPGLQYYTQTMPTFICQELYSQCITQNANDATSQKECKTNISDLCGTLDPPSASSESSTTAAATTAAATKSASDSTATGNSVTSTTSDGLAAPTMVVAGKGAAAAVALGMLAYLV